MNLNFWSRVLPSHKHCKRNASIEIRKLFFIANVPCRRRSFLLLWSLFFCLFSSETFRFFTTTICIAPLAVFPGTKEKLTREIIFFLLCCDRKNGWKRHESWGSKTSAKRGKKRQTRKIMQRWRTSTLWAFIDSTIMQDWTQILHFPHQFMIENLILSWEVFSFQFLFHL